MEIELRFTGLARKAFDNEVIKIKVEENITADDLIERVTQENKQLNDLKNKFKASEFMVFQNGNVIRDKDVILPEGPVTIMFPAMSG